jgi:ribulose-5-phosphate 4-epimerase/fuculose-1-phosphate aldolase
VSRRRHTAVIVEELAVMAWMTVTINPAAQPISQHLRDKHHFRKHGPSMVIPMTPGATNCR